MVNRRSPHCEHVGARSLSAMKKPSCPKQVHNPGICRFRIEFAKGDLNGHLVLAAIDHAKHLQNEMLQQTVMLVSTKTQCGHTDICAGPRRIG